MDRGALELYKGQPVQLVKKRTYFKDLITFQGIIIDVREFDVLFKETDGINRRIPIDNISSVRMA